MVLQNYQNLIEMTSNIIDIVAFGVGIKCPRKIHLNTQWGWGGGRGEYKMTPKNRIYGGEGVQKLRQKIGYHLWMFP